MSTQGGRWSKKKQKSCQRSLWTTPKYTAPERAAEDRIEINAKIMMNGCLGRHCNHDIKPFLFHLHGTNFVAHNWAKKFLSFMRSYLSKLLISNNFFFQIMKLYICRGLFMKFIHICVNPILFLVSLEGTKDCLGFKDLK